MTSLATAWGPTTCVSPAQRNSPERSGKAEAALVREAKPAMDTVQSTGEDRNDARLSLYS